MALVPLGSSEELEAFAEAIRDFAAREGGVPARPGAADGELHDDRLYRRLGELGWIGACLPERYGGAGGGVLEACVFLEQAGWGQLPIGAATVSLIVAKAVEKFGTEVQKDNIIGAVCAGEPMAIAISEPNAGSDVGALTCRAERVGDTYVVSGQKTWISQAHRAQRMLLVCRTDRSGGKHDGISMLLVDPRAPGVEVRGIDTLGGREVNDVFFQEVEVGAEHLIGVEGQGWRQLMAGLNFERLVVAANLLGVGRRAFDDALAFVSEREQFGRPVGSFQVMKHRIADLATELECSRLLVYEVARLADQRPQVQMPREASMAKLKATETARRVALEGMQMMGGYGYATEYRMESHVRRTVISTVYGGTSEIQREIIGRSYGL